MRHRLGRVPLLIALAPASLVLVHNLAFLAEYGAQYQAALLATGHDGRWTSAVTVVIGISVGLAAVGLRRLGTLWLRARSLGAERGDSPGLDARGYLRVLGGLWPWLAIATAVLFLGQENLERASLGQPLPGLEPLIPGTSFAPLVILAAVSFLLAAFGALFLWGTTTLSARIAAALHARRSGRMPVAGRVPARLVLVPAPLISLNLGRRAPPVLLS